MKSRIVFMFVVAAFLNPMSAFADGLTTSVASSNLRLPCEVGTAKAAKKLTDGVVSGTHEIVKSRISEKVKTSNDAG